MGLELHSGGFLRLRKFCKFFEFDPLCNVVTLVHNVATSQRRDIERSQKPKPLSCRDVGRPYFGPLSVMSRRWPQRCDAIFQYAQERRDVGF